jgi:alcohol dehydrogenase YqhD (iron-dependent ADH family)
LQSFIYHCPTKVIFGSDAEMKAAAEIKRFGGTRVMLVYGGGSAAKSGLLDKIRTQLADGGIPFTELSGVKPNPLLSTARSGIEQAVGFGADFILAIGGGSAIDTAKAIAHGAANPGTDIWSFWIGEKTVEKSLPVGVVLTISAAGSETSDSAVITNEETGSKRGLSTEFNRPKFALMNPELTYTLPKDHIITGVVDIMMHTLDRYFTSVFGNEITDEIAESLLRVVIKNGAKAIENPRDYQAMSEIMWCGSLSHNGLTGLGAPRDFSVHQLGHELSAKFNVVHGSSLSAVWGSWALYCYREGPERFARYGKQVWGIEGGVNETASSAIEKTVDYFRSIGAPVCFSELGIGIQPDEMLRELADRCVYYGKRTVGQFKVLRREDIYEIYKLANR